MINSQINLGFGAGKTDRPSLVRPRAAQLTILLLGRRNSDLMPISGQTGLGSSMESLTPRYSCGKIRLSKLSPAASSSRIPTLRPSWSGEFNRGSDQRLLILLAFIVGALSILSKSPNEPHGRFPGFRDLLIQVVLRPFINDVHDV
jgi:hypothetical protein